MARFRLICNAALAFARDEQGPTATEYAVLLALIVLVAVAAIHGIGSRVFNLYTAINAVMPT
jgi:pilus assembly protein Flp/PilA